jgi:hypothetical protein
VWSFLQLIGCFVLGWGQVLLVLHRIGGFVGIGCYLCKIVLVVGLC